MMRTTKPMAATTLLASMGNEYTIQLDTLNQINETHEMEQTRHNNNIIDNSLIIVEEEFEEEGGEISNQEAGSSNQEPGSSQCH